MKNSLFFQKLPMDGQLLVELAGGMNLQESVGGQIMRRQGERNDDSNERAE